MTLFLKARMKFVSDEAAMKTVLNDVLPGFVGADENGEEILICYTHQWSVDWDIPITKTFAVFDDEGNVTSIPVMESGFFCNVQIHDPDIDATSLEALDQKPATPQRRFA